MMKLIYLVHFAAKAANPFLLRKIIRKGTEKKMTERKKVPKGLSPWHKKAPAAAGAFFIAITIFCFLDQKKKSTLAKNLEASLLSSPTVLPSK